MSLGTIALTAGQTQLLGYFMVWQGQEMGVIPSPALTTVSVDAAVRVTDRVIGQVERLESNLLERLDLDYRGLQRHTRQNKPMRAFLWDPRGPWTRATAAGRVTDDLMWLDMARTEARAELSKLRRRLHGSPARGGLELIPLQKPLAMLEHGLTSRIRLAQHAFQYVQSDARESLRIFFDDDMRTAFEILTLNESIRQQLAE